MFWQLDSSNNLKPLENFPVALQFGYSVYTTFVWPLDEAWFCAHLARLEADAAALGMAFNHSPRQIRDVLESVVPANEPVVRLTIAPRMDAYPDLFRSSPGQSMLFFSFRALPKPAEAPLKLRAIPYNRPMAHIKHGSMLDVICLKQEAVNSGYDDVLFIDEHGHVSEASTANVVAIRNGKLQLPEPHRDNCLPGITAQQVRGYAAAWNIPTSKEPLALEDLLSSDGVMLTNAVSGIQAVGRIDKTDIAWTDAARKLMGDLQNMDSPTVT